MIMLAVQVIIGAMMLGSGVGVMKGKWSRVGTGEQRTGISIAFEGG